MNNLIVGVVLGVIAFIVTKIWMSLGQKEENNDNTNF